MIEVEFVLEKLDSARAREKERERWDESESDRCCSFPHLGIITVYTPNVK